MWTADSAPVRAIYYFSFSPSFFPSIPLSSTAPMISGLLGYFSRPHSGVSPESPRRPCKRFRCGYDFCCLSKCSVTLSASSIEPSWSGDFDLGDFVPIYPYINISLINTHIIHLCLFSISTCKLWGKSIKYINQEIRGTDIQHSVLLFHKHKNTYKLGLFLWTLSKDNIYANLDYHNHNLLATMTGLWKQHSCLLRSISSPVIDWCTRLVHWYTLQGVPHLSPEVKWDWMDGWIIP